MASDEKTRKLHHDSNGQVRLNASSISSQTKQSNKIRLVNKTGFAVNADWRYVLVNTVQKMVSIQSFLVDLKIGLILH